MKKLIFLWLFLLVSATAMFGQVPFAITVAQNPSCMNCDGVVVMSVQSLNVQNPLLNNTTPPSSSSSTGSMTTLTWTGLCQTIAQISFINVTVDGIPYGQSFNFQAPTILQVSVVPSVATCTPGDYVQVFVGGGVAPFSYSYTQNGVPVAPNQLQAGEVSVTVTDVNGCSGQGFAVIPYAYVQNVNLSACQGGTANYNGIDYVPGTYTFPSSGQATDGCDSTVQLTVGVALQDVYVNGFPISCNAVQYQVFNAPASATYLWSSPIGMPIFDDPTQPFMQGIGSDVPGSYIVVVTDENGCSNTVDAPWVPGWQLSVNVVPTSICGDSITIALSDPTEIVTSVQWSNGSTDMVTPYQSGTTISVTVTTQAGCIGSGFYFDDNNNLGYILNNGCSDSATLTLSNPAEISSVWWETPNGQTVAGLTIDIIETGVYTVHADYVNGCHKTLQTYLSPPPPMSLYHCEDQLIMLLGPQYQPASISWYYLDAGACTTCFATDYPTVSSNFAYTLHWYDPVLTQMNQCYSNYIDAVDVPMGCPAIITGRVFYDDNSDCTYQAAELNRPQGIVTATNEDGTYVSYVQADGTYVMAVVSDTFEVAMSNPSFLESTCNSPQSVEVSGGETETVNLGLVALANCPSMNVHVSTPFLRRCMLNGYYISYCNQGTAIAESSVITLTLDPLMTMYSSSVPYTNLGGGVFQFNVGDVAPWECGDIQLYISVSCAANLGQTLCVEAHITPNTICMPMGGIWDGSQVIVTGECDGDSVRFYIQNIGAGDMAPPPLEYIVIEDQIILMTEPFSLPSLNSLDIALPANGSTWRVEAAQTPGFPWPSLPSAQIEGCLPGGGSFSTGFINQYPLGDLEPYIDIACNTVVGSWDPNDKTGYPIGYDDQHFITPETPIEYLIRFQNTGTDTAFRVVIRDTLSEFLDITTFQVGASSHLNRVELLGQGILEITFDNIMLPDSNVNEVASHGMFNFTINPKVAAPLGTEIHNTAHIYFDYNEAVVTNTTLHTLGRNFITVTDVVQVPDAAQFSVFPNPTSGILQLKTDRNGAYNIRITDLLGRTALTADMNGTALTLDVSRLNSGMYVIEAIGKDGTAFTAKLNVK